MAAIRDMCPSAVPRHASDVEEVERDVQDLRLNSVFSENKALAPKDSDDVRYIYVADSEDSDNDSE